MARQTNIIATVFGGAGDEQPSAYPDVAAGWPDRLGVALPVHISGIRGKVAIYANDKSVTADIVDVGPWNTHDPYWDNGSRPQAESGTDLKGRHTNGAGIDLTPQTAKALGIDGKGIVDWEFVSGPCGTPVVLPPSSGLFDAILTILKALLALFTKQAPVPPPPAIPTSKTVEPLWVYAAKKRIGFHEKPNNTGLEQLISEAHCGSEGDPWCAIFVNASLETAGIRGTRSPAARSFEHDPNFVKLQGPALGAIVTNWRGSPSSGLGHVYLYAGEGPRGILALGGNQSDQVQYQYEPRDRVVGYWWPASQPLPSIGPTTPSAAAQSGNSET